MGNKYFSTLNYSLGNEDTTFEFDIINRIKPKKVLTIAGCGSRALPLISRETKELHCIDIAKPQLHITKLREETIKQLSQEEYLKFWGFYPYGDIGFHLERKRLFNTLKLDSEVINYFIDVFNNNSYAPLLYEGKWEKTFQFFSRVARKIFGDHIDKMFLIEDQKQREQYFYDVFPQFKWKLLVSVLGNRALFNALLYKGDFIQKNVSESYVEYYQKAFHNLLVKLDPKASFFTNLCFFGQIQFAEGNTIETREDCFNQMKDSLLSGCQVFYHDKNLFDVGDELAGQNIDFLSLSDVPSYFQGDIERDFLQKLKPCLNKGAIVVIRYYLKICEVDDHGFVDITNNYQEGIDKEKVQMYRVKIYRYE